MRAAALVGPNAAMPAALEVVHEARHERRLGADHHQVDLALLRRARPRRRPGRHSTPSRAMPALPGAQSTSGCCGLRSSVRTRACSRPPGADDEDALAQSAEMKSSTGIAERVS